MPLLARGRDRHPPQRRGEPPLTAGQPVHVCFLANSLVVGGAERVVQALCLDLPRHGIRTSVGCLREAGPVGRTLREAGVPLDDRLAPRRLDPLHPWRLRRFLRRARPDAVYVLEHSNALLYGRIGARLAGVAVSVCAVHRTRRADGSPSLGRVDRLLMRLSDRVIAVSAAQARYLAECEGIDPSRLAVVHNGVDPEVFEAPLTGDSRRRRRQSLGLPPVGPLCGIVAALRPEKNHRLLLEALVRLGREGAAPQLVVVGEGSMEAELRRQAEALGVAQRVHWLGGRDDVPRVLACLDVLALSSHPAVETFPLCVLEAMAARLPVVATRVGSLEEMVVDGTTGILVPPGDADALAQALAGILAAPERARAMGQAGRRRVEERFTRSRMVEETARLLRGLLERKAPAHP